MLGWRLVDVNRLSLVLSRRLDLINIINVKVLNVIVHIIFVNKHRRKFALELIWPRHLFSFATWRWFFSGTCCDFLSLLLLPWSDFKIFALTRHLKHGFVISWVDDRLLQRVCMVYIFLNHKLRWKKRTLVFIWLLYYAMSVLILILPEDLILHFWAIYFFFI